MNDRSRRRRVLQIEALEDRLTCSASAGLVVTVSPPIPDGPGVRAAEVQSLQDRQGLRDAAARRRIDRAFANLDRSLADLDRALDRLEADVDDRAAVRGFRRANGSVVRAANQLDRALAARPRVVQEGDLAALQRAFDEIGRLEGRALLLLQRPSGPLPSPARV